MSLENLGGSDFLETPTPSYQNIFDIGIQRHNRLAPLQTEKGRDAAAHGIPRSLEIYEAPHLDIPCLPNGLELEAVRLWPVMCNRPPLFTASKLLPRTLHGFSTNRRAGSQPTPPLKYNAPPTYIEAISDLPPEYVDDTGNSPGLRFAHDHLRHERKDLFDNYLKQISVDLKHQGNIRSHKKKKGGNKKQAQDNWTEPEKKEPPPDKNDEAPAGGDNGADGGGGGAGDGGGGGGDDGKGGGDGGDKGDEGDKEEEDEFAGMTNSQKKKAKKAKKKEEDERRQREEEEAEAKRQEEEEEEAKKQEAEEEAKKQAEEEEANKQAEEEEAKKQAEEEERKKEEEKAAAAANEAADDGWGEFATTSKKKKKKKDKAAEATPAPPPESNEAGNAFQDITLDSGAPKIESPIDGVKSSDKDSGFNGWSAWNTGGGAFGGKEQNADNGDDYEFGNAWADNSKKSRKKKGADEVIIPEEVVADTKEPEESAAMESNIWPSTATSKKDKKKKKGAVVETVPIVETPVEPPEAEKAPEEDFWGFTAKKGKKKKGTQPLEMKDDPPPGDNLALNNEPDPALNLDSEAQPKAPEEKPPEDDWPAFTSKKDKKKKKKGAKAEPEQKPADGLDFGTFTGTEEAAGEEQAPVVPEQADLLAEDPPPEPAGDKGTEDNFWSSMTAGKTKKKKGAKGASKAVEEPKVVAEPEEPVHIPEPDDAIGTAGADVEAAPDEWGGFEDPGKKKKQKKKKGEPVQDNLLSDDIKNEEEPQFIEPEPAAAQSLLDDPDSSKLATGAWSFWGAKKTTKEKTPKASKTANASSGNGPTVGAWDFPPSDAGGFENGDIHEASKGNPDDINADATNTISTELVKPSQEGSWGFWDAITSKKSNKKSGEPPPPAPTPPIQGLNADLTAVSEIPDEDPSWHAEVKPSKVTPTSKKTKEKKPSKTKTKAKGFEVKEPEVVPAAADDITCNDAPDEANAPPPSKGATTASKGVTKEKQSVAERIKILERTKKLQKEALKGKDKTKEVSSTDLLDDLEPLSSPKNNDNLDASGGVKSSKKSKSKTKAKAATLTDIDDAPAPRDSVPGSFPDGDDDLVDVAVPKPDITPEQLPLEETPIAAPDKPASEAASVAHEQPDMADGTGETKPAPQTAKAVAKERARIGRTAGVNSWALWGAAPKKPTKKETPPKEDSPQSKKEVDKPSKPLTRSNSTSTKRDNPKQAEVASAKPSLSDKESRSPRSSRQNKGLSLSNFMLGGQPPQRTKTARQPKTPSSKPVSRRQSIDIGSPDLQSPDEAVNIPGKAAKLMGIDGPGRSPGKRRSAHKSLGTVGDKPPMSPSKEPIQRHRSKRDPTMSRRHTQDTAFPTERKLPGEPDPNSARTDPLPKTQMPLRRSDTLPKKAEGIFGLFSFRKLAGEESDARERSKSRSRHGHTRRNTDTEMDEARHRKRASVRADPVMDGFESEPRPSRVRERRTKSSEPRDGQRPKRSRKPAPEEGDPHADPHADPRRAAGERAAKRAEKARIREARSDPERAHERRKESMTSDEKRARRAARAARTSQQDTRKMPEEDSHHQPPSSRHKRRPKDVDENFDESRARYAPDQSRRRSHRPGDEIPKPERRKSTSYPRQDKEPAPRGHRPSRRNPNAPYSVMVNGGKDKTSSWVNSQLTDPPEAPPIVPTVIDMPPAGGDQIHTSTSDDEEIRRAARRRRARRPPSSKPNNFADVDIPENTKRRGSRRVEREVPKYSEGSGDNERYVSEHRGTKGLSWFKKIAGL